MMRFITAYISALLLLAATVSAQDPPCGCWVANKAFGGCELREPESISCADLKSSRCPARCRSGPPVINHDHTRYIQLHTEFGQFDNKSSCLNDSSVTSGVFEIALVLPQNEFPRRSTNVPVH